MLDFAWSELLVVIVVAVLVIGPKDMPAIMFALGRVMRRVQYIRYAFTQQFEDFMKEADLQGLSKQVNFEAPVFDESAADDETHETLEPPVKQVEHKKDD
jgi:sec-independent protein translocase protein TatB